MWWTRICARVNLSKMSLAIPDNGLLLEGPTEAAARRSTHAFAVPLSADLVAQMIESAQNGGKLQLSLSDDPVSLLSLSSPCPQIIQEQMHGLLLLYLPLKSASVSTPNPEHVQYSIAVQSIVVLPSYPAPLLPALLPAYPHYLLTVNRFTPGNPH